jgi:hypothetical protein
MNILSARYPSETAPAAFGTLFTATNIPEIQKVEGA